MHVEINLISRASNSSGQAASLEVGSSGGPEVLASGSNDLGQKHKRDRGMETLLYHKKSTELLARSLESFGALCIVLNEARCAIPLTCISTGHNYDGHTL